MDEAKRESWLSRPSHTGSPAWQVLPAALLVLGFVVVVDRVTGYEFGFHAFYIFPVLMVAWSLGTPWGLAYALLSAVAWYFVDRNSGRPLSSEFYRGWDAFNHLIAFGLIAGISGRLRRHLLRESALLRENQKMNAELKASEEELRCELAERTKAEGALKAGQSRHQDMLETAMDGVWLSDSEGRFLEVNEAACSMLKRTREELLGLAISDIEAKESVEANQTHMARIREAGFDRFQSVHRRKDGTVFPVEVSATFQRGSGQFLAYIHDITQRQQAEERRIRNDKVQAALYRIALATLEMPSLRDYYGRVHEILGGVLPAKNFYVAVYDPGSELLSFPYFVDELDPAPKPRKLGMALTDFVFTTGKAQVLSAERLKPMLERGTIKVVGTPPRCWLGVPLILHGTTIGVMAVQDYEEDLAYAEEDLELLDFIATQVAMGISHRQAEASLVASEEKFSKVFRSAPILIALTDLADGRLLEVNDRYCQSLGYIREELVGRSTLELGLVRPEDRKRMTEAVEHEGHANNLEFSMYTKNGKELPCLFSGETIEVGDQTLLLSMVADITELKKAEEERHLLQAGVDHMRKLESLGRLAGGVAHDMNNVLAAILALASAHLTLQEEHGPTYKAFATIRDAATRGGDMVKRLLNFARQRPGEIRSLDFNELLLEQTRLLERTTLAKVQVDMSFAPDLRPIHGDASALAHAIMNLCVNAVDAMDGEGTLLLQTRNLGQDQIEVMVGDTGCGMTKGVLEKAIDPFFTTKEVGKGTGLGLSLVYTTVLAHGGRLEIQSEPGQGTKVRLHFPINLSPTLGLETAAASRHEPVALPMDIVLVDDDELVRRSIRMMIEILGHAVTLFASGEEALARFEAGLRADVVVLDMNMPGLGGKGTLPRLRLLCPTLPVILATGRADQEALDLVAAFPHVTLMSKPFSLEDLQGHLRALGQQGQQNPQAGI